MNRSYPVFLWLVAAIAATGWSLAASTGSPTSATVPEGASMVLLAPALFGLGLAGLFRRHRSVLAAWGAIGLLLILLLV